ncbi:prophage maintenance system killer protein [Streptomyces sp. SAI-126]|uniref:Fic family protein n=1 Tax=Streptomyces sp. SAI-126 TaxID=3377732 RepID=UPI0026D752EC
MTTDALAAWLRVRSQIDWTSAAARTPGPVEPVVDGLAAWCSEGGRASDLPRGHRLLAALARSRQDASHGHPLTCTLLTSWQQLVLGMPEVQFRQGDAFAKGGRERYALTSHTERDFEQCLRDSSDQRVPLASRAARAYLDVIFFHPFPDGNARLAMLTLAYVLESEGVRLDQVGPLQTTRYADDAAGAADLAALVFILIRSTRQRAGRLNRAFQYPPAHVAGHRPTGACCGPRSDAGHT